MKHTNTLLSICIALILSACTAGKSTSVLYADNYDKTTDMTVVTMLPYGTVKIPGKWTKTRENPVSGQIFFVGQDSIIIAIALQEWNKYEFSYNNPSVTLDNFVKKYYEWDANYLKDKSKGQLKILVDNKEKNYLVWNLTNASGLNDYYLFGLKGKTAYNLNVDTKKWDEERKIKFLERIYNE